MDLMAWVALGLFCALPLMGWYAYTLGRRAVPPAVTQEVVEAPGEAQRFRVTLNTRVGSRARKMYEAGQVGVDEVLELWDGEACRGRKLGPTAEG